MKLRTIIKDKKGGMTDIFIFMIFALIIVFFSGIFIYAGSVVSDKLHEDIGSRTHLNSNKTFNETISQTFDNVNVAYSSLYWITLLLVGGMILSIFIGSYMVTTKPVVFIPYLIIMIIAVIVSVGIANAYDEVITQPELTSVYAGFVGTNFIMYYLPLWVSVIGIFGGVIMFVRFKTADDRLQGGFG